MQSIRTSYKFALYSKYFLINQTYVQDMYFKRIPYKQQHQELLDQMGKTAQVIGGALFPYTGAQYIVNCNDVEIIKQFLANDPYTKEQLAQTTYEEIETITIDNFDELAHLYDNK